MTIAYRSILINVPGRQRTPHDLVCDEEGVALLESLSADAAAFAGVDAQAPMRRDLLRTVRAHEAGDDDY